MSMILNHLLTNQLMTIISMVIYGEFVLFEKTLHIINLCIIADQLEEPYMNDVNDISNEIDCKPNATSDAVCLSKVMSSSNFASDLSRLIASETSEYCYFNTQLLKKKWSLKSMGHWNPFVKKSKSSIDT